MASSLVANQVSRVTLAIASIIASLVPFSLLWRLGEVSATIFVGNVMVTNLFTLINASIWHDDNMDAWWDGVGYCDLQTYLVLPMQCIYAACIFAIMRNLAQRLRLKRATELTLKERRRQTLHQALIIFPVPLIQLALTWPFITNRFVVGSVVGCFGVFGENWFKIVIYNFPPAFFSLATVPYAFLTWKRFREISKTTQEALAANTEAAQRAQRTRRRLYGMALSIMVPYVPLQMVFFVTNLTTTLRNYEPYSYNEVHNDPYPYPWEAIIFVPSYLLQFAVLNQPWIAILTAIPIVLFFGKNAEAMAMYRIFFTRLGVIRTRPTASGKDKDKDKHFVSQSTAIANEGESETIYSTQLQELPRTTPANRPQIIMSSSGPFIPPRRSFQSHSTAAPDIPPRGSSLRTHFRTPLQRIASSVRLPSGLSTLFSGGTRGSVSASNMSAVSPHDPIHNHAQDNGGNVTMPFSQQDSQDPSSTETRRMILGGRGRSGPEDPPSSGQSRSPPSSIWNYLPSYHHVERSRQAEPQASPVEDVGDGFVRVRIVHGKR